MPPLALKEEGSNTPATLVVVEEAVSATLVTSALRFSVPDPPVTVPSVTVEAKVVVPEPQLIVPDVLVTVSEKVRSPIAVIVPELVRGPAYDCVPEVAVIIDPALELAPVSEMAKFPAVMVIVP